MSIVLILSIGGWIATTMVAFYGLKECGTLDQIRKRMMLWWDAASAIPLGRETEKLVGYSDWYSHSGSRMGCSRFPIARTRQPTARVPGETLLQELARLMSITW
jgi:hypothetical protein